MQALKQLIGNARIVSLGEATHGTREFFQLKHRMLEFLATEMGFTIFSIEANMPEAYRLNDYVLNGTGDPAELLRGMYFWTWNTEEVLEMIRWMRAFNASGRGRVRSPGSTCRRTRWLSTSCSSCPAVRHRIRRDAMRCGAHSTGSGAATGGFGVATGTLLRRAAGKTVRFSGYIKTRGDDWVRGFVVARGRRTGTHAGVRQHVDARRNCGRLAAVLSSFVSTPRQGTSTSGC
jgi:hypothetical protein